MQLVTSYVIRHGIVERENELIRVELPNGDNPNFDQLKDKQPPEGSIVYYRGKLYSLVVVQAGINDLVFEVVIDTEDHRELRLGTNLAVDKENRSLYSSFGVSCAIELFFGRQLRTGAPVRWREEEGWYQKSIRPDSP